jgi:hypothetical protein
VTMSTLLPADIAPPQDEHTRATIQDHIQRATVHVVNGELIVSSPGSRVTFARRDKNRCGPRSLSAYTRFYLTGLPASPQSYKRSVVVALFEIATGAMRVRASDRVARDYKVSSFVTRLNYLAAKDGSCFRATGHVRVNDQVVDVLMKITS